MGIGTTLAVVGGSLGAAGIGAAGSLGAASTQAGAANNAAALQYQSSQNALNFQKQMWQQQQQNVAPWLQAGGGALGQLSYLLGIPSAPTGATGTAYSGVPGMTTAANPNLPTIGNTGGIQNPRLMGPTNNVMPGRTISNTGTLLGNANTNQPQSRATTPAGLPAGSQFGSLLQGWNTPFVAPTAATEQNDPGYQFRLQQGLNTLQNSAAARGGLLSGNTLQGIEQYSQDYASNEYNNVYNRALGQYEQNYNIFQNNQANEYNRLASMAGLGQTTAQQLNATGSQTAGNVANTYLTSAGQIGNAMQAAGGAMASGYAGAANAASGALGNLGQYALLQGLLGSGQGSVTGGIPQELGGGAADYYSQLYGV